MALLKQDPSTEGKEAKNAQDRFHAGMAKLGDGEDTPEPSEPVHEEDVTVSLDDDDDEGDDDEPGQQGPTRSEKKRERRNQFLEAQREAKEAKERAEQAERANHETRQALAQLSGYVAGQGSNQQQGPDRLVAMFHQTYADEQELGETIERMRVQNPAAFQAALPEYRARIANLHLYRGKLQNELIARENAPRYQQAQIEQARRQLYQNLEVQNPDVFAVPEGKAVRWAEIRYEQLVAEGHPVAMETVNRALADTRAHFGLKGRSPAPSSKERRAYSGHARGGTGGGNGSVGTVVMTKTMQSMAESRFPNMEPAAAHKEWAKRYYPAFKAKQEGKRR